jgi:hypothetical protein
MQQTQRGERHEDHDQERERDADEPVEGLDLISDELLLPRHEGGV